jgi:hypothetical protein
VNRQKESLEQADEDSQREVEQNISIKACAVSKKRKRDPTKQIEQIEHDRELQAARGETRSSCWLGKIRNYRMTAVSILCVAFCRGADQKGTIAGPGEIPARAR